MSFLMLPQPLNIGDVVQIDPDYEDSFFRGCLMIVTEYKPQWGAQGYIAIPGERGALPGRAYFRCPFAHMEYVGRAVWIPSDDLPESPATTEKIP